MNNFSLHDYLRAHNAWSARTFGTDRKPMSIIKHLRKELEELQQKPDDILEYVDIIILAADGAFLCQYTPNQVVEALMNTLGEKPDDGEPNCGYYDSILHVCNLAEHLFLNPSQHVHPNDTLRFWIEIATSAFQMARAAGFSLAQITFALQHKQSINFKRRWPTPGDPNEPTEHLREGE